MGNKVYASTTIILTSILLLFAFIAIVPQRTEAATLTDQLKKRLCDRQDRLAHRLARPLIDPVLCKGEPAPNKPTLELSADPESITEGESATLEWDTTNADTCTASGDWSGEKNTNGSQEVSPDETSTYTLTCTGEGGSVEDSVTITVEDEPLPEPNVSIEADPDTVAEGATTTLSWQSEDADVCIASNGWSGEKALDGSQEVTLSATTTYTIACGNGTSTSTDSVTVNVTLEPEPDEPTVEISADPTTIEEGATTTLTWNSENADTCTASDGWSGEKSVDGSQDVSPNETTTYTIECTGEGGSTEDSVTVTVNEDQDAPTVTLDANPLSVTPGEGSATSTLTWTTSNADVCLASGGWSGSQEFSGTLVVQPSATTTYTLDCGNEAGTTTDSVIVDFVPEPDENPTIGHVVISEVHYDVASSTVTGNDSSYEWIELHNGTDETVDLQGWFVGDASSTDMIDESFVIQPGSFAVIVASTTPAGIPGGVPVLVISSSIGLNGFGNAGDGAVLLNASESVVDQVGYGTNTTVSPNVSIPGTTDGHSLVRTQLTEDTDTSADWADTSLPDPGQ